MSGIIITCALTGSIHTPSMSPHLPITGPQIAQAGREAADAGAAILHLHARHPVTGQPLAALEHFNGFVPVFARVSDAVLKLSTGGSAVMSLDDRLAAPLKIGPERPR